VSTVIIVSVIGHVMGMPVQIIIDGNFTLSHKIKRRGPGRREALTRKRSQAVEGREMPPPPLTMLSLNCF
jgi:hypothetical protein